MHKFQTVCKHCVFAQGKYNENNEWTNFTQEKDLTKACKLDLLKKYGEKYELKYDRDENGDWFYTVEDGICVFQRPPIWAKNKKEEELGNIAREEIRLKPDVLVYVGSDFSLDDILVTLNSLNNAKLSPSKVYIVNNSEKRPSYFVNLMEENCKIAWRVENIIGDKTFGQAMDLAVQKCKNSHLFFCHAGYKFAQDYFYKVDKLLYDELYNFVCVFTDDSISEFNGLMVSNILYKMVGGYKEARLEDKIKNLVLKEEKNKKLVRKYDDIMHGEVNEQ